MPIPSPKPHWLKNMGEPVPDPPKGVYPITWNDVHVEAFTEPVEEDTVGCPFLPLGTEVEVQLHGVTTIGFVKHFGTDAHEENPERFITLHESMLEKLVGKTDGVHPIKYRVVTYAKDGEIKHPDHEKTDDLEKRWNIDDGYKGILPGSF